jgi:hypothetical protein
MARITAGALTGAGFSQAPGSTTKYVKTNTTAVATVELATGGAASGFASISQATPGSSIAAADWAAHVAVLGTLGLTAPNDGDHGPGLVYVGQTV